MNKKHVKSPCCGARVVRFGQRRRQCLQCHKTWRVRQKKRGRKKLRTNSQLVLHYFKHSIPSLCGWSKRTGKTVRVLERRLRASRDFFLKHTAWPKLPTQGELICLGDGLVFQIRKQWHTCYLILIREIAKNEAIIYRPVIFKGTETSTSWGKALDTIPSQIKQRIRALVCDGHRGLVYYAMRRHWLIQRCHFHLLAAIGGRRSRSRRSRHKVEGDRVYALVKRVLSENDEKTIPKLLLQIDDEALNTSSPELRKYLRGFLNCWEDFRSYLYHPKLNLPTTNNTAESLAGCFTELLHRARGFSTLASIEKWFAAFAKYKKTIKCRGRNQPN